MQIRAITGASLALAIGFFVERAAAQITTTAVTSPSIEVRKIEIQGNTVFTDEELQSIVSPFKGEEISVEKLLQLRSEITQYYVEKGYRSSGAFLPAQEITDGTVQIQVIEGKLEAIEIEGLSRLSEEYILSRLPEIGKPLKVDRLAEHLEKLQRNPLIEKVNANLSQESIGSNILALELEEAPPFRSEFALTNGYSPSIGRLGGTANFNYQNFLGDGDRLSTSYTQTEGLTRWGGAYSFPFNSRDGTISFSYTGADSKLVEEAVSALDIQAEYDAFQLNIRQPVISTLNEELAFEVGVERIQTETFILEDISFPFTEGLEDGKTSLTALRLAAEYTGRGEKSLLTARSQLNVGIDVFDPTVTETGIDGIFWSWQGQLQWARTLNEERDAIFLTKLDAQLTPDTLLPVEQFGLGGVNSVRGYRQNSVLGDGGITGTVELQLPVIRSQRWGSIKIAPFFDAGTLWNNSREVTGTSTLASVGIGLSYTLKDAIEARIDYGIPLIEAEGFEDSSGDRTSFTVFVRPFQF